MTDIIICKCCNKSDFRLENSGPHMKAICNITNKYIKFVSYAEPAFYFGKYKDIPISKITDLNWLEWAYNELIMNDKTAQAVIDRIDELKKLKG